MSQTRILIIDDAKNIRQTVQIALESEALSVEGAPDGEEGLALLETGKFRLAFLDLSLPGMPGMEVLRRIRKSHPEVAVVIITAFGTMENSVEAMKLGAMDFLAKPFTPGQIRDLVRDILARPGPSVPSDSTDPHLLMEMAKVALQKKEYGLALSRIQKAVPLASGNPDVLNLYGVILEIGGEALEAQKWYRAALSFDSAHSPARRNLERLVLHSGKGDIIL